MFLAFLASFIMMTQAPPLDAALTATEAPRTLRAAFTVELQSQHASRVYSYDPRNEKGARWQVVSWQGEDDELEEVAANWANEAVAGPEGGKLTRYEQSYFIRTEPRWGMSYVSSFSIDLEARAAFRTISRRYSANIIQTEFFFASAEAETDFEIRRKGPQLMSGLPR